jgi:hypothetical protein
MSLTGKEFKQLIDSTIDTSSIGEGEVHGSFLGFVGEDENNRFTTIDDDAMKHAPAASTNTPRTRAMASPVASLPPINDQHRIPRPQTIAQQSASTATAGTATSTRHHRRASSSRFLLNEWAMESHVRNMYGASPPADLPHEITLLADQQHQSQHSPIHVQTENHPTQEQIVGSPTPPTRWSPRRIFSRPNDNNSTIRWLASPFALDGNEKHSSPPKTAVDGTDSQRRRRDRDRITQEQRNESSLSQPLLPSLRGNDDDDNDEELGGPLLGEAFLPTSSSLGGTSNRKFTNLK